jgi:type I restriction enzyme S subunit
MGEWKEHELGKIVDVRDGTHDSPKEKSEGKYLITSRHIKNGKIDLSKAYKISFEDFEQVNKRSKVDKWDILFSMIGTVGEIALIDFEPDFAIKNIGLFKTGDENLAKWIIYYLKSTEAQNEIFASLKGSTQQYITLGDLRKFPILLPPLSEQKAIASVLSSLDDKIDLLHRQNKTLEAMAETLFRQWFVEEAQEDWEENSLLEIIQLIGGGTPKTAISEYWNGDIPWLAGGDISSNHKSFINCSVKSITRNMQLLSQQEELLGSIVYLLNRWLLVSLITAYYLTLKFQNAFSLHTCL